MVEILSNRSVIQIAGVDSQKFLQGMLTNDIIKNTYSYNFLLNNQGRYLFDLFVYQQSKDSYFLDVVTNNLDSLLKKLNIYKLRSKLEIKDLSDEYKILYSQEQINCRTLYSIKDPRYLALGYRSLIINEKISDLQDIVVGTYFDDKYNYSIVDGNTDFIYERSIPPEYGADELHAISYDKGCYVGQEFISRVKHQGILRKKIFKLKFSCSVENNLSGVDVTDCAENKIGIVCSSYKNLAIALVREEKFLELKDYKVMVKDKIAEIVIPLWRH